MDQHTNNFQGSSTKHPVNGAQSHPPKSTTAPESIALEDMADAAQEPLMQHEPTDEQHESEDVDFADVSLLLEKNLVNPGLFVWLLTFSAGISGLLFGCMLTIYVTRGEMLTRCLFR